MTDKQNYFTYTDNTSDSNDKTMESLHKQIMIDGVDVSGCEYFKINRGFNCYKVHNCTDKECYNCYYKQFKRKEQECEELKEEVQQALKKNAENYSNSCLLQKEVNQLKEQIKRLQEDLKIRCDMYFKESHRSYKLSEISCEWNARKCIETLEKFLINDDTLTDKIANISSEMKRFFKECTPNKDRRLSDFIPEDEYTKCLKAQEQLNQLRQTLQDIQKIATHCMKQDICTICDYSDKCHIEDEEMPTYDVCKLILHKISECEVNNG